MAPLNRLAGALALMAALPLCAAAAPAPETLYHGALIRFEGEVPDRRETLAEVDKFQMGPGVGLGFRRAIARPELDWYRFALFHGDSVLVWDAGDSLALVVAGRVVTAVDQFAMSQPPTQRPIPLLGRLRPQDLWRVRLGPGIATVVFAGFPRLGRAGANPDTRVGIMVKTRSQPVPESVGR